MCRNCNGKVKYALRRLLAPVRNKRASTLVIVLVTFAVLMVIGVSLMAVVSYNHKNASDYHRKQQAEYTARGVMEAIASAFGNPSTGNGAAILSAVEGVGVGNTLEGEGTMQDANMGTYKVKLTLTKVDEIHAEVFANYLGMNYKVSAHFEKNSGGNALNPLEFIFFSKNSPVTFAGSNASRTVIDGNISQRGAAHITYTGFDFLGKFMFIGDVDVSAGGDTKFHKDTITTKKISAPATAFASGAQQWYVGATASDGSTITADKMGYGTDIQHDQRPWSPIKYEVEEISPTQYQITFGNVSYVYPSTYTMADGSTPGARIDLEDGDYIDTTTNEYHSATGYVMKFTDPTPIVTNESHESWLIPPTPTNGNVTLGGRIGSGSYSVSGSTAGAVEFDTSGGDIHLYATGPVSIGHDVTISGENLVYFHMKDNNFSMSGNILVGENGKSEHQLFIEGNNGKATIDGAARLKGCIYLLKGIYEETNPTILSDYKIKGSITADSITASKGYKYKYVEPIKDPEFDGGIKNNYDPSKPYFIYPQASGGSGDNWGLSYY